MGWADCGEDSKGRPIGYAWEATCDHPGCEKGIDRGLAYACGGMHGNGTCGGDQKVDWDSLEIACEGYFCEDHQRSPDLEHEDGTELYAPALCDRCATKFERLYREDEEYRDLWPTVSPTLPLNTQGIEARQGRDGEAGSVHESPVGQPMRPTPPSPHPRPRTNPMSNNPVTEADIGKMFTVPWSPNPHRLEWLRPKHCQLHGEYIGMEAGYRKRRNSEVRPWGSTSVVMADDPRITLAQDQPL